MKPDRTFLENVASSKILSDPFNINACPTVSKGGKFKLLRPIFPISRFPSDPCLLEGKVSLMVATTECAHATKIDDLPERRQVDNPEARMSVLLHAAAVFIWPILRWARLPEWFLCNSATSLPPVGKHFSHELPFWKAEQSHNYQCTQGKPRKGGTRGAVPGYPGMPCIATGLAAEKQVSEEYRNIRLIPEEQVDQSRSRPIRQQKSLERSHFQWDRNWRLKNDQISRKYWESIDVEYMQSLKYIISFSNCTVVYQNPSQKLDLQIESFWKAGFENFSVSPDKS